MANELIAEAITDYLGERCLDYAEGCPTCEAWAEYDRLYTRPAAPVEGLEVVSYEVFYAPTREWTKTTIPNYYLDNDNLVRELVTRSQAEAIIAAEQMKLEATAKVGLQLSEQIEVLETQLAAARKALDIIFKNPRSETAILDARAALEVKP